MWNKLSNKVGNIPHYLTRRNGVFYACFRLPTALSQHPKVIRRSLHTRDAGLARLRLAKWLPIFQQIKEMAQVKSEKEQLEDLVPSIQRLNELTAQDERSVVQVVEGLNAPLAGFPEEGSYDALDAIEDFIGPYLKERLTVLENIETEDDAPRIFAEYPLSGLDIAASEREAYRDELLYLKARLAKLQGDSGLYDLMRSQLLERYLTPELVAYREREALKEAQDKVLADVARQRIAGEVSRAPAMTKTSPLLSESYKSFIKFKKTLTKKNIKDYDRHLDFTLAMLGDIESHKVTKQALRECLEVFQQMPLGNRSPYNQLSMAEKVSLAKAGEIPEEHLIKVKTVIELLKFYQGLFSAFLTDERDIFEVAPTKGLKKPEGDNLSWGAYNKAQGRKIYEYWLAQPDSPMRWVFLLVLFTGMRRSEIANVSRDSLKQNQDSGRYYLWIQEGKTAAATRPVTIAKELETLGFVEYLRSLDGTLYPAERLNDITETANKVRQLLVIGETEENGKGRLVFHSFRHSFITFKQEKNVDYQRLQRFVGHEGVRSITTRYTHAHMITDYSDIADGEWWV
ncbi:tyrosine-type recombinase/integrase [Aeromonas veronii]|uniref:tyrosine-type recombinase/integrase n=2 Tax=Aeromonas veronii TaxID=654 RepID=UPI001F31AA8B|nr:tyrosine-type recombinase/integrase [Aeromonas veronii]MCF5914272.1 tyrosine-type recombinase/integrase [Aeromonas veronii]